jgi:ribonuclease MRP protein subunit RMP1
MGAQVARKGRAGLRRREVEKNRARGRKMKLKMPKLPRSKTGTTPSSSAGISLGMAANTTTTSASPAAATGIQPAGTTPTSPRPQQHAEASTLQSTLHLLDKIFYRNRNQHRGQHWWKFLALLRKALRQLNAVETRIQLLLSSGVNTAEAVRARLAREKLLQEQKVEAEAWIREVLMPRCYLTFTRVVADEVFCGIGVVLVAVLGGVGGLVGFPAKERDVEVQRFTDVRVRETVGTRSLFRKGFNAREGLSARGDEDVGEVIERKNDEQLNRDAAHSADFARTPRPVMEKSDSKPTSISGLLTMHPPSPLQNTPSTKPSRASAGEKKRKKAKKVNAIDDLFGDLA